MNITIERKTVTAHPRQLATTAQRRINRRGRRFSIRKSANWTLEEPEDISIDGNVNSIVDAIIEGLTHDL